MLAINIEQRTMIHNLHFFVHWSA